MSHHRVLVSLTLLSMFVLPTVAAGSGDRPGFRPVPPGVGGPPITNVVHDLLDEETFVDLGGDTQSWVSPPFKTAQFNRAILKAASEAEDGFFRCYFEWQFTPDDEFEAFSTSTGVIGDDINPRPVFSSGTDRHLVYGVRARVRCDLVPAPDFGIGDPPPPATGSLTDVKVLLRRE